MYGGLGLGWGGGFGKGFIWSYSEEVKRIVLSVEVRKIPARNRCHTTVHFGVDFERQK